MVLAVFGLPALFLLFDLSLFFSCLIILDYKKSLME